MSNSKVSMKGRKKKKVMLYFFIVILILITAITLFLKLHPNFGGNPSKEQKKRFATYDNYKDGKFINLEPVEHNMGISSILSMIGESFSDSKKDRYPSKELPVSELDWNKINSDEDSVTWFGHSTFLFSIDNNKILVDPMLSHRASPVSFAGGSERYGEDFLAIIDELPTIDAVFLTHDHYDHLDYESILRLKGKVSRYYVPLGVGSHLIRWGIESAQITEFNWWDQMDYEGLTIAFTPSRHFSGRGLANQNSTLWGGWVIAGDKTNIFISGDGSYGQHFKEIGNKYGPFNYTFIEGAQYDKRWEGSHMKPEDAVQAHIDVNGTNMMLSHWGAFTLAFHSWTEPIERGIQEAERRGVKLMVPMIGETVEMERSDMTYYHDKWWIE